MPSSSRVLGLAKSLQYPLLLKKRENIFYLLGKNFMTGWLLVYPSPSPSHKGRGNKKGSPPLVRGGIEGGVIFLGDGLEKVGSIHSDIFKNVGRYLHGYHKLLVEDGFSFAEADFLRARTKHIKLEAIKSPVDQMRQIKDDREIGYMRKSGKIVEKVWKAVKKELPKKIWTEANLAHRIQALGEKFGANGVSFDPIVASGSHAAIPHHQPTGRRLKIGESIIIDFGFKYRGYCSDFTRTVFLKSAPRKLAEAYKQVERAYLEAIKFIDDFVEDGPLGRPKRAVLKGCDVYQKAVEILAEKKLEKYFIHNLGHGCGLAIHEKPSLSAGSKEILQEGMVFSIEPGVYLPDVGGIRIEDLVYLHKQKVTHFTNAPTDLAANVI